MTTDRALDVEARRGIAAECAERRDTYLALAIGAATAANLAAVAAVTRRRPDRTSRPSGPISTPA
ncbi:hypothetical protein [Kribbella sp. NPDC048915]|uniref:hypothetical protein n=1 Tax=Kribbella sp. NPDC048915 TaxID=3155148 RepID=UPI0033E62F8E